MLFKCKENIVIYYGSIEYYLHTYIHMYLHSQMKIYYT